MHAACAGAPGARTVTPPIARAIEACRREVFGAVRGVYQIGPNIQYPDFSNKINQIYSRDLRDR